jgi:curli biogenesis system outer membrane secretion channel CsgG
MKRFIALLCLAVMIGCSSARPRVIDNYFRSESLTNKKNHTLVVLPFENHSKVEKAGHNVSEEFNIQLGRTGYFTMVERARIEDILDEQDFLPERIDQETAVRIGKLLGARTVVLGTVSTYKPSRKKREESPPPSDDTVLIIDADGDDDGWEWCLFLFVVIWQIGKEIYYSLPSEASVGLNIKIVDVETGEQLWAASEKFKGGDRDVQALLGDRSQAHKLTHDIDLLTRLLCRELAKTIVPIENRIDNITHQGTKPETKKETEDENNY